MACVALAFFAVAIFGDAIGHTYAAGDARGVPDSVVPLNKACRKIAASVSAKSNVYWPESPNYQGDIHHWGSSSTRYAACSFEPGTPKDVGIALRILGKTRTPFAVKGGGHTSNPGFSSTEGVQISMTRFSGVHYDPEMQTAMIGSGLLWDDVYSALDPHGVNVVGGRVPGVGVAGFALGGGYSWLTNQYGLTIDTIEAFQLVVPNGTVIDVTEMSSPDLFFALKGGMNNFGIVTTFTLKVFPQTQVWGGVVFYAAEASVTTEVIDKISQATANFAARSTDPKAVVLVSYNYILGVPQPTVILFYDGPTCPPGIFDEFLAITPSVADIGTRSFPAFVKSIPVYNPQRVIFNSVPVTGYPLSLLRMVAEEANSVAEELLLSSVTFVDYDVEPFLSNLFSHNTTPTAYPPDRSQGFLPLEIYYSWTDSRFDQVVYDRIQKSVEKIRASAVEDGQDIADAAVYPNFAIFGTPLVKLYGANVPRLQAIKKAVDPDNVMGLTGGFKL